jgi:hypothetical protein
MMETKEASQMAVCTDCLSVLANGECEYPSQTAADAHGEGMTRMLGDHEVTLGWPFTAQDQEDWDAGIEIDDQLGFSWRSCDGCGSPLGGDRFKATIWI